MKAHHNEKCWFEQATKLVKKLILSKKFPPKYSLTHQIRKEHFSSMMNKCLCECYCVFIFVKQARSAQNTHNGREVLLKNSTFSIRSGLAVFNQPTDVSDFPVILL